MTRKGPDVYQTLKDRRGRRQRPVRQYVRCRLDGPRKRKLSEAEAVFRRIA